VLQAHEGCDFDFARAKPHGAEMTIPQEAGATIG
jgi:hypothetical protein